ncbi:hypothetical protein YC2023_081750 [Brassica napus]
MHVCFAQCATQGRIRYRVQRSKQDQSGQLSIKTLKRFWRLHAWLGSLEPVIQFYSCFTPDLQDARSLIGRPEKYLHGCLNLNNNNPNPSWFILSQRELIPTPSFPYQHLKSSRIRQRDTYQIEALDETNPSAKTVRRSDLRRANTRRNNTRRRLGLLETLIPEKSQIVLACVPAYKHPISSSPKVFLILDDLSFQFTSQPA